MHEVKETVFTWIWALNSSFDNVITFPSTKRANLRKLVALPCNVARITQLSRDRNRGEVEYHCSLLSVLPYAITLNVLAIPVPPLALYQLCHFSSLDSFVNYPVLGMELRLLRAQSNTCQRFIYPLTCQRGENKKQ